MMLNNKKTGLISLFTLLLIHATVSFADAPVNQSPNLEASQQNQHVFSQQDYQEDFNLFIDMYENIDWQSVTAVSINTDVLAPKELARVVKGIQAISNHAKALNFKTTEGQQVQQDFIENNDFSIQGFQNQSKLKQDKGFQQQMVQKSNQLEQKLAISLGALKDLAEQ